MGLRHEKVIAALKREISNIVQYELKDSRLGFVTIMRVDLTPDLRYSKVYFSVLGGEREQKATKQALESAKPFIRCLIGQRIKLRFVPEISFKLDRSAEYSIKIQKELDKIKTERENSKL
ncbi:MAG: 30S ribosome-binding factor RbfA [Candidatus Omnitrophota bacterium]|jgi:ribosome-binding factor A